MDTERKPPEWIEKVELTHGDRAALTAVARVVHEGGAQIEVAERVRSAVPVLAALPQIIRRAGAAIVSAAPIDDDAIVALGAVLGDVAHQGEQGLVYSVTPADVRARSTSRSLTTDDFALHTDSTLDRHPHRFIALATVRPDERGGRTILARLVDALERIDEATRRCLLRTPVPFAWEPGFGGPGRCTRQHVLVGGGEQLRVRWRGDLVRAGCELERMPTALLQLIDSLEAAFDDVASAPFFLRRGEILVVDNARVLHGRTRILDERREVKRVKIHERSVAGQSRAAMEHTKQNAEERSDTKS